MAVAKSIENQWSYCPVCKHWVPTRFYIAEWDPVDEVLTRMCFNCARDLGATDLPAFKHEPFRYEPLNGIPKCPLCGKRHEDTRELDNRSKSHKWLCGNCHKEFIRFT